MGRPTTIHRAVGRIWSPRSRRCPLTDCHCRSLHWGTSTTNHWTSIHWRPSSSAIWAWPIWISRGRRSRCITSIIILRPITRIIAPVASVAFISIAMIILVLIILLVVLLWNWPSRVLALWWRATCAWAVEGSLGGISCVVCHLRELVTLCIQFPQSVSSSPCRLSKSKGPFPLETWSSFVSFPSSRVVSTGSPARDCPPTVPVIQNYPVPSSCDRDEGYTELRSW